MNQKRDEIRVALLGCGTVGGGVIQLLINNREHLQRRIGAKLSIAHVLVRDPSRVRVAECDPAWLTTDESRVLGDPSVDLVVEVMGGEQPAKRYIERAIASGKSVVSANKMMLARHGSELLGKAAEQGVDLAFEASVGGGIPVIRTLRDALTSDRVKSVHAILNGTCNYILTRMRDEGLPFAQILADAQRLGYAEAEPSLDVDGHDAAQKLVVLAMLAFGAAVDDKRVHVEGIRSIDEVDFRFAQRFGFSLKHLAIGYDRGEALELRVHPALVPNSSPLAGVNGVLNGVFLHGHALGPCLLVGRGAGDMPTAVSVVADVVDAARARVEGAGGLSTRAIKTRERPLVAQSEVECRYYLRFDVADEPGVLATIAGALGKQRISVEHMVQEGRATQSSSAVSVLMITHTCQEGAVERALSEVAGAGFMKSAPRLIRIEDM
ncbi:MAG TPA: homoserine dehydrogenase [Polyangiaceae bacterium]|nr:homoserine dehydrogenase [Polyangiaceae bacterium]